jgi:hypothetical protein
MIQIKVTDLEIVQSERENEIAVPQNTAKAIANLAIDNMKKGVAIQQLTQMVANLNIEIKKLQGGTV